MTREDSDACNESNARVPTVEYAEHAPSDEPGPLKLPGPPLRRARQLAVVAAMTLPGSLLATGQIFCLSPMIGLFLAFLAMIYFLPAPHRDTDSRSEATLRVYRKHWWSSFLFCLLIFFGQGFLMLQTLGRMRDAGKATVTSANLRGIGQALKLYHEDFEVHAPSLADLEVANYTTRKQFLSIADPGLVNWSDTGPAYSSFAYNPGVGSWSKEPDIVLAFEKEPWTATEMRLFPKHGRWVLFGDGSVKWLQDAEFRATMELDRARRLDLGWPRWSLGANAYRR